MSKKVFCYVVFLGFGLAQSLTEFIAIGSSLYVLTKAEVFALASATTAAGIALFTGLGFEGGLIISNFSLDKSRVYTQESFLRLCLCTFLIVAYLLCALSIIYLTNYFLILTITAWYSSIVYHVPLHYSPLSLTTASLVALYTIIFDFPFMLSGELFITVKGLSVVLGVPAIRRCYGKILKGIARILPLIALLGSGGHVVERLASLPLLLPINLLQSLDYSQWVAVLFVFTPFCLFLSSIHLLCTYLSAGVLIMKRSTLLFSSAFHSLIKSCRSFFWTQSLYYGIFIALPSAISVHVFIGFWPAVLVGVLLFTLGSLGTYYSEVLFAVRQCDKIEEKLLKQ